MRHLGLGLALALGVAGCGTEPGEGARAAEVRLAGSDLVFVDTHDNYAHTGAVDKSQFGKYFQKVNGRKALALTFDCAWVDKANGEDILDALKRNGIKATFFISGPFIFKDYRRGSAGGILQDNLSLVKRIIDEGHEIGNHTSTHPHNADHPNWTWETTDLRKGWDAVVKQIYGSNAPANATMKPYWRAPYGEYDTTSLTTVARAGFPFHFGWNVDVRDTIGVKDCRQERTSNCLDSGKLTDYVLKFAEKNSYDLDAFVVLAHLSNYYFWGKYSDGIDRLASTMRSKGYEFARVSQAFRFSSSESPQRRLGEIECPSGFSLKTIGNEGGRYCEDTAGKNVLGPFTEAMKAKCAQWGGGNGCKNSMWARDLALAARGTGLCPAGATLDEATGYCAEGDNAFGPFPSSLVAKCQAAGGGEPCKSARWDKSFLLSLQRR